MIFITGDVHGDIRRFHSAKKSHIKKHDTLIICGDFGFIWDGGKKEKKILKKIGKLRYNVLFVDGCNENYDLLNEYEWVDFCGSKARKISGNLYCLMRGGVYTIEDKKVFAFGGGDAIDENSRNKNAVELLPTPNEMQTASANLTACDDIVDIIVTHDAPQRIRSSIVSNSIDMNYLHTFLEDIRKSVKFNQWYFGKYHINRRIPPHYNMLFTDIVKYED